MGLCCSSQEELIYIPEPPNGFDEEPPPGYEYIPLEEYIVAVEINVKPKAKHTHFSLNYDPMYA